MSLIVANSNEGSKRLSFARFFRIIATGLHTKEKTHTQMNYDQKLARLIDHTALKPDTTTQEILKLCREAAKYKFAAVCVPPYYVHIAVEVLADTEVKVATVVGFPLGYSSIEAKLIETDLAIEEGAHEIDMVINIAAIKQNDRLYLMDELLQMRAMTKVKEAQLKVIIETALLDREEIIKICELCASCKVDFVKTSTGFAKEGATLANIQLMREILPKHIQIKASGGIRDRKFAMQLVEAGANRLGCSGSLNVIKI